MDKSVQHIVSELKKHPIDYVLFIFTGCVFLTCLILTAGQRFGSFLVILAFCAFYIFWGIYHHATKHVLRFSIVIEYILIGFLVLFLLRFILLR